MTSDYFLDAAVYRRTTSSRGTASAELKLNTVVWFDNLSIARPTITSVWRVHDAVRGEIRRLGAENKFLAPSPTALADLVL
jgi:hypothetical protein